MRKSLLWITCLWITCFAVILLSACATNPTTQTWLTKEIKVNLPTANLDHPYDEQQLLTFNHNGQKHSLITLVKADSDSLIVVGLSTLGIRIFKIEYRDNTIATEQNIFIKQLPPASQILSDIMLSIYPIQKWQAVLPQGWQLIDNGRYRKLLNDKQEIIVEITYQQSLSSAVRKPINIKHYRFGYQIAIENME